LTKNKKKLIRVAEKLVIQETLESEELESLFGESAPSTPPEATEKPALKPATAKIKTKPVVKEAPAMPQFQPKQAPATPD
jgi:hypothetical protein